MLILIQLMKFIQISNEKLNGLINKKIDDKEEYFDVAEIPLNRK